MTDTELLALYHQTRNDLLTICGHGSTADESARHTTFNNHGATLDMIKKRFPDITFPHSTAEWHLQNAITPGFTYS